MRYLAAALLLLATTAVSAAPPTASFKAGFGKVDITPQIPVRLSGYANRDKPFTGVQTPIFTRVMAFQGEHKKTFLLVAIDTIGIDETFSQAVAARLEKEFGIPRARVAFSGTHSHTTPHLAGGILNLYQTPMTAEEQSNMEAYTKEIQDAVVEAARQGIQAMVPAQLSAGVGKVGFAMNRRVIKDGICQGMAPFPSGTVDDSVEIIRVTDSNGKVLGVAFNYACHATTLTGTDNAINGDWPGYAASDIEEATPGVVALSTIGCGADANPEPRGGEMAIEHAKAHGRALALEVGRLLKGELTPLTAAPTATFGHANLQIDVPTKMELESQKNSRVVQEARRAEELLAQLAKGEAIPNSYPMPIQGWHFGDQLSMVFLGGEVVVDYAHRLKRELPGEMIWVTAYANDVFGYLASERVRAEGGYEVDFSQIFYNQPGRWSTGTEENVIKTVKTLAAKTE